MNAGNLINNSLRSLAVEAVEAAAAAAAAAETEEEFAANESRIHSRFDPTKTPFPFPECRHRQNPHCERKLGFADKDYRFRGCCNLQTVLINLHF